MMTKRMVGLVVVGLVALAGCSHKPTFISGSLEQFQPVTLDFNGPSLWEAGPANPFIDYRMTVQFTKGKRVVNVPGYYAADGQSADSAAKSGHVWRAHFLPDEPGEWKYVAFLEYGLNAAVDDTARVTPVRFSGTKGKLNIAPANGAATGFARTGPLRYANCRYARFDNNQPFIANGASLENLLAYEGFTGAVVANQFLHSFLPHTKDVADDDPSWQNGKGAGLIGAVNYLAGQGVNCLSFSTYNIDGGTHGDVWVWSTPADKLRFSVSRLAQWEAVFSHMSRLGVVMQLVTQESGNDNVLGDGELTTERKLYYRELVARFAHHPGLIWNLGQNNGNTDRNRAEFAAYIHRMDPYKHPIVIHAADGKQMEVFTPLLGFHALSGVAMESSGEQMNEPSQAWMNRSAEQKQKWSVTWNNAADSENPVAQPDADDPSHDVARQGLWANLLAGGSGAIWPMGEAMAAHDPATQDFRRFERLWRLGRIAVDFLQENVPLLEMVPANPLVKSEGPAYCLAGRDVYLVYFVQGQQARLTAPPGNYEMIWLNPRTGEITGLPNAGDRVLPEPPQDLLPVEEDSFEDPADTDADMDTDADAPADADDDEPITAAVVDNTTGELPLTPPAADGKDWVVLIRACK